MRLFKPRKIYYDPYGIQESFPSGYYEIWTAKSGYEGILENLIVSRMTARDIFWEKKHRLLRFYFFAIGIVISWREQEKPYSISKAKGIFSICLGKCVINLFDSRIKKEKG